MTYTLLALLALTNGLDNKEAGKFFVYGGGCSRSIRLQSSHATLAAAYAAAENCRNKEKLKWVSVRTGAHERDYFGQNATRYDVYTNPCRGWTLVKSFDNAEKASEFAKQMRQDTNRIEVVRYYAPK